MTKLAFKFNIGNLMLPQGIDDTRSKITMLVAASSIKDFCELYEGCL